MRNDQKSCNPKIAVAYARYSSAGQRDVSIEQQLQDIRAFAQREGYTIVHEYADHAKSGYKNVSARLEFQRMLEDAKTGSFGTVIAWKVDRFGRNRRDSAVYKGQLRDRGVDVIYAMEPIPEGAAGVLTEGMLESIAEWYSRNLSENVNRGLRDNALKGLCNGSSTYGYHRGSDGRLALDPDQAAVVRLVFDQYLSGYSAASIADSLNASGLKASRGKRFTLAMILRMISNERYTGVYIWRDIRVPDAVPVIVSHEEWERAQEMKRKTGRHIEKSPADFILTGKVFCGFCGKPMVGDSGRSHSGSVYYYYTCTGHKSRGGSPRTCDKKSVRKEYLESQIIDYIYDHCLTGPMREKIADAILEAQKAQDKSSPRAALIAELKATEKKISNINDAIESGIWNASTSARLRSLEDSAESLRASLRELEFTRAQLLDRERIMFFLDKMSKYDRNNINRQKQLMYTFVNSIFVYDDHIKLAVNAVEGASALTLADVNSSDYFPFALPDITHPNPRAVIFWLALGA